MFGLGATEILFILVVALLVLGPKRLPQAAQSLGRTLAELRRSFDEVKREISLPRLDLDEDEPTSTSIPDREDNNKQSK